MVKEGHKNELIVLSVGGSLIVPNGGINVPFLQNLNAFIRKHVASGKRFFLVSGGGRLARTYRDAGKAVIGTLTNEDLDWLGIHATRLNGHLLRTIFQDIAHPRITDDYDRKLEDWHEPVAIASGWKPGWSTDYDTVILARDYGAKLIVNMSNIDMVFDKDPNQFPDAKPFVSMNWDDLQKLVGSVWTPGKNIPFDPIAVKLSKELGLTVVIAHGEKFDNLDKIIDGDPSFIGTTISP